MDLWTGFLATTGWSPNDLLIGSTSVPKNAKLGELLRDGLHFSSAGNMLCFQLVFAKIKEVYPELDPDKMETKVPWWDMQKDILAILAESVAKLRID